MAFFEESANTTTVQVEAIECHIDNMHEAALNIVAETQANYNALMQAVGMNEYRMVKESGEAVYTEGALSNFWAKVKKFFVNLLAKIKGLFNKFMSKFDAYVRGGKSFYDKYKKQLAERVGKIDKDKVKFMGYEFSNLGASQKLLTIGKSYTDKMTTKSLSENDAASLVAEREKTDEIIGGFRADLVNQSGDLTASEFSKELFKHFRSDQTQKEDVGKIVDLAYFTRVLGGADKAKTNVEKAYKDIEKGLNDCIKACEKGTDTSVKTQLDKDANDGAVSLAKKQTAAYPILIKIIQGAIGAKQAFVGAQMQAIGDEISQAKHFASLVIRTGALKEYGTSWSHTHEGAQDDFLSRVEFR